MSVCYATESINQISVYDDKLFFVLEGHSKFVHFDELEGLVLFGKTAITPSVINTTLSYNVPITFLSSRGKLYGVLDSNKAVDLQMQKLQMTRLKEEKLTVELAKNTVKVKSLKRINSLKEFNTKLDLPEINKSISEITKTQKKVNSCKKIDIVLEYEDLVSRYYFSSLFKVINDEYKLPLNSSPVLKRYYDSLFRFGYTLLMQEAYTVIKSLGLNPYIGYLHENKDDTPALALDIMSEWSSDIVDTLVMDLLNENKISMDDFIVSETTGNIHLNNKALDIYIKGYEEKVNSFFQIGPNKKRMSLRQCIVQRIESLCNQISNYNSNYLSKL